MKGSLIIILQESSGISCRDTHSFFSKESSVCGEKQRKSQDKSHVVCQQEPNLENWNHSRYFKSGNLMQGGGCTSVRGIKGQNETLRKYKDSCGKHQLQGWGNKGKRTDLPELAAWKNWSWDFCGGDVSSCWEHLGGSNTGLVLRLSKVPRGWTNAVSGIKYIPEAILMGIARKKGKRNPCTPFPAFHSLFSVPYSWNPRETTGKGKM